MPHDTSAMTRARMVEAGGKLRQLREQQQLTQQEVERRTESRFGADNKVYAQQISRIEKGVVDKPPILDLLRFGQVLGLTPDDIAEMYDLWPTKASKRLDPRIQMVLDVAEELEEPYRDRFLEVLRFSALQARADQRLRERERSGERSEDPDSREAQAPLAPTHTRKAPRR